MSMGAKRYIIGCILVVPVADRIGGMELRLEDVLLECQTERHRLKIGSPSPAK